MKKGIEVAIALVSLCSLAVGLITAVFGSRGDISPSEAAVCLWAGIAMAIFGILGFCLSILRKERWLAEGSLVFLQVLAFASILRFGP
jgi:CBS domain containing-hemolysin-like protein